MRAGNDHERQRDRQALIRHVSVEQHARQHQIVTLPTASSIQPNGWNLQRPVAHGKKRGDGDDRRQEERCRVGIDLDDEKEALELAVELPE